MSRDEIIEKLTPVAIKLNLDTTNVWVVFIINMAAEVIFLWQSISTWKVLESSLMHCTKLNSALQHVSDLMYCTNRGYLPRITVKGAVPLNTFQCKKYDLCAEISGKYLYFANDYNFDTVDEATKYEFELIVSDSEIYVDTFSTNKMYYDLQKSCTMDISLYLNENELKINQHLRDVSSDNPYMQITIPNYWLRIVNNNIFSGSDSYTIKYFLYPNSDNINEEIQIESLPQFKSISEIKLSQKFSARNEDINNIKLGGVTENKSNFLMATRSDIDNYILTSEYLKGIKSSNIKLQSDKIEVIYLLEDLNSELDPNNITLFIESIKKAYYITQEFEFKKAEPVDVDMQLTIYYSEKFNQNIIDNKLYEIQSRIGRTLIYDDLIAELIRAIPEIKYIDQIKPSDKQKELLYNQRIKFTNTEPIIYKPYTG